jgi:hypothetical protein
MQFEPLGVAVGAASFTPGYLRVSCTGWRWDALAEPAAAAQDFYDKLWASAIADLEDHARRLGADGVVGVTASQGPAGPGWQLQLTGTAFRLPSVAQLSTPFLSLLPMSAVLTLLAAGWVPGGIAWGVGAFHVHGPPTRLPRNRGRIGWSNVEMPGPTQAVMAARDHAERAVAASLIGTGCHGTVGMSVDIQQQVHACYNGGMGRMVIAAATGTAVARFSSPALRVVPSRQLSGVR